MVWLGDSKLRKKLLAHVFTHPNESFYVRELALLLTEDAGNLSRELRRLEGEGLFRSQTRGRQKYYSLNQEYSLYKELKQMVAKTEGVEGSLRDLVQEFPGIELAFIYGSYANDSVKKGSDIDLVIVGKFPIDPFTLKIRSLEQRLAREINFTHYVKSDFEQKRKEKGSFLNEVLRQKMILLKGAFHAG